MKRYFRVISPAIEQLIHDDLVAEYDRHTNGLSATSCPLCRKRPIDIPVSCGPGVCLSCARGIPLDMLPASWRT